MLYCTKKVLEYITREESAEFIFINKNGHYEDSLVSVIKQKDTDKCYKDGVAAVYSEATIICEQGKYKFNFVEFSDFNWDTEISLNELSVNDENIKELLSNGHTIVCLEEEVNNIDSVYMLECIKENKSRKQRFSLDKRIATNAEITTESIKENLNNKAFAILPLKKEDGKLMLEKISFGINQVFSFYKQYCPKMFYSMDKLLEKCVELPDEFLLYKYCVVSVNKVFDNYENEILEIELIKELDIYDIMEFDNKGTSHLFIVNNYSNIDVDKVTNSLKNVCANTTLVDGKLLLDYIKKAKLKDISWIEDYLMDGKGKTHMQKYGAYEILAKLLKSNKKVVNFDKVFNFLIDNAEMKQIIVAVKENKNANFDEIQQKVIARFNKKNEDYYVRQFAESFSNVKLDEIKKILIAHCLKEQYFGSMECFFTGGAYNLVDLFNELKASCNGNKELLSRLDWTTQDLLKKHKMEQDFVDVAMELLLEIDTVGERCHNIATHTYYSFRNYESNLSKFSDRINEKVRCYNAIKYRS